MYMQSETVRLSQGHPFLTLLDLHLSNATDMIQVSSYSPKELHRIATMQTLYNNLNCNRKVSCITLSNVAAEIGQYWRHMFDTVVWDLMDPRERPVDHVQQLYLEAKEYRANTQVCYSIVDACSKLLSGYVTEFEAKEA